MSYDNRSLPEKLGLKGSRGDQSRKIRRASALALLVLLPLSPMAATWTFAWQLRKFAMPELTAYLDSFGVNPYAIFLMGPAISAFPEQFQGALLSAVATCLLPLMLGLTVYRLNHRAYRGSEHKHGSAHWADLDDIKAAGLMTGKGVYCCGYPEMQRYGPLKMRQREFLHHLRHDGPQHMLLVAPTRSGKGVSVILPTLFTWEHSVFCTDIKGENFNLTAGYRRRYLNNRIIRLEFTTKREEIMEQVTDEQGQTQTRGSGTYNISRWNPLEEIRMEGDVEKRYNANTNQLERYVCTGDEEIGDAQNLALLIVDPDGKGLDDHWKKCAFELCTGLILHLKHNYPEGANIRAIYLALCCLINTESLRCSPERDYTKHEAFPELKALWEDMKKGLDKDGKPYAAAEVVKACGASMANKPDEERGSVVSTLQSFINLWNNQIVAENTACSDFKISDLMDNEHPVSAYLIAQPDNKDLLQPLMKMLVVLATRKLTGKMQFRDGTSLKSHKNRLLFLLDEFPSLGKMDIVQEMLAYAAGYGVKFLIIIQDFNQLHDIYGDKEKITGNCHIQIFFANGNMESAKKISELIGTTTINEENVSYAAKNSKSYSEQSLARALLTPDEVASMPSNRVLVKINQVPAILGTPVLYYKVPQFLARAKLPPPEAADTLYSANDTLVSDIVSDDKKASDGQSDAGQPDYDISKLPPENKPQSDKRRPIPQRRPRADQPPQDNSQPQPDNPQDSSQPQASDDDLAGRGAFPPEDENDRPQPASA